MQVTTRRLELISATAESCRAAAEVDNVRLGRLLDAAIPADWPHEYLSDGLGPTADALEREPQERYTFWFVVLRSPRTLIGTVGLKAPPVDGRVDIGYGIVLSHRRRGYATEATQRLIELAFEDPAVERVVAETLPELTASLGVLDRCGFVRCAEGVTGFSGEENVVRYELSRHSHSSAGL